RYWQQVAKGFRNSAGRYPVYLSYQLLRSLDRGGLSAAEQRAADEHLGRAVAAAAASWRRAAEQARTVAGLLSLSFRNKSDRQRPEWADEAPPCVRAVPEPVAKSQLNGHPVR